MIYDKQHTERELWILVLENAWNDAIGAVVGEPNLKSAKRVIDEARQWFASENKKVGSFRYICDWVDYDPGTIRKELARRIRGDTRGLPLGTRLRIFRIQNHISQRAIAGLINYSDSAISAFERADTERYFSDKTLADLTEKITNLIEGNMHGNPVFMAHFTA